MLRNSVPGGIDHAIVGKLLGAERGSLPVNGLDHIAALGAEATREPKREAVGGHGPGLRNVATVSDEGKGRPHRYLAEVERPAQGIFGVANLEP